MGIAERKQREKELRRKMILDAAEGLFFNKGINQTTMEEVAEKAELSKGTLYLYFRSKEDIRFAIFQRGANLLVDMMESALSDGNSGHQNLLVLGRTFIDFSKKYRNFFNLFIEIQSSRIHELDIEKESLENYLKNQSPLTVVQACVDQGIKDGSIRDDLDEKTLGAVLWSQLLGVLTVINNHGPLFEILEIEKEHILETHLNVVQYGGVPRKDNNDKK